MNFPDVNVRNSNPVRYARYANPNLNRVRYAVFVWCLLLVGCVGWQRVDPGASAAGAVSLRGLAVVDAECAWVSGTGGTILRTVDGGRSWQDVAPEGSADCDFRDVEAFDRDTALAMVAGQPARVYRTADGGGSWQLVYEDSRPAAFFDALARDGDTVVLFGDAIDGRFALLVSQDAGRSWRDRSASSLPPAGAGEAGFAASGQCLQRRGDGAFSLVTGGGPARHIAFAFDAAGGVASGGDAAITHVDEPLPLRRGPSAGAFAIAWSGARAVVVGGDYADPETPGGCAALTEDGGRTWAPVAVHGFRSAVAWLDEQTVLAVGSHGASLSRDGGRSFEVFQSEGFHACECAPDGTVWAVGSGGRVARLRVRP